MPALHELAKQVFRTYVFENDEMDMMREAQELMQPIGSSADDEQVLVTTLANARRATGKPDSSALWDLHAVNSHAENLWRDYYILHRHRLDELVDSYLTAESSSASSTSGSFSDAESLSIASSPPTSVADASGSEDNCSERSRQSPVPGECSSSASPSRATSLHMPSSPADLLESRAGDDMDIFSEEDRASAFENTEDAVEPDISVDATLLAPYDAEESLPEVRPEPMDEEIMDSEAVTQPTAQSSPALSARSPSLRYETPPSFPSVANELSAPQTPSASRSTSESPRRGERLRRPKKRPDEAVTHRATLKPSSTASSSSRGSSLSAEPRTSPSTPTQSRFVYVMNEEMGRAGSKTTLGDLRACARFLAKSPDVASMTRDGRGKAFSKLHRQRTYKAWAHIFTRFDSTITDLAEAYRSSGACS